MTVIQPRLSSYCGTNGLGPVMTLADGSWFYSGPFMTTTDALQDQLLIHYYHTILKLSLTILK